EIPASFMSQLGNLASNGVSRYDGDFSCCLGLAVTVKKWFFDVSSGLKQVGTSIYRANRAHADDVAVFRTVIPV
ncbi:MAG: hypothetical protein ACXW3R_16410, partial [Rhodoplanes sp.]